MKKIGAILIIMMLVLCGCEKKSSNVDNKQEIEIKNVELTDEELVKVWNVINVLSQEKESLSYNDFTNQEKIGFALDLLAIENTDPETYIVSDYEKSKDAMTDVIKRYFGQNAEIAMEDYMCEYCVNEVLYNYNVAKEEFEYAYHGHGYSSLMITDNIISTKQKGNEYLIEVARLYAGPESDIYFEDPTQLFKTATDAKKMENMVMDIKGTDYCSYDADTGMETCDFLKVLQDNPYEFAIYTYTFNLENENLIFNNYKLN
ncbi:MAG: hypothetical protein IJO63_04105 [Bacilli bacterium]|nr:hypothetical protein [Bacilli bacterium]